MSGHGPDADACERGRTAELKPQYLEDTLVFLFETSCLFVRRDSRSKRSCSNATTTRTGKG